MVSCGRLGAGARDGTSALGGESGQALVLGVLFLGLILILMLVVPGLAIGYALRAGTASAADAAALACASNATISQEVDARGHVYRQTVVVDAAVGPLAAATTWSRNLGHLPLTSVAFNAMASGPDCSVTGVVQATLPILHLLARGRQTYQWATYAEAKVQVTRP